MFDLLEKNILHLAFQFKMHVKGKKVLGHLNETSNAPTKKVALDTWETQDTQIISWILVSIEPRMVNNVRPFSTAKATWDHLKIIYDQNNVLKRFQLELDIVNYR